MPAQNMEVRASMPGNQRDSVRTWPVRMLSRAPMRTKILSTGVSSRLAAGTQAPACAMMAARHTCSHEAAQQHSPDEVLTTTNRIVSTLVCKSQGKCPQVHECGMATLPHVHAWHTQMRSNVSFETTGIGRHLPQQCGLPSHVGTCMVVSQSVVYSGKHPCCIWQAAWQEECNADRWWGFHL